MIYMPCDEYHVWAGKLGISGVRILKGEKRRVFQPQEVTFAKAKPEETCSFNNREVAGCAWSLKGLSENGRTRGWKGRICQIFEQPCGPC